MAGGRVRGFVVFRMAFGVNRRRCFPRPFHGLCCNLRRCCSPWPLRCGSLDQYFAVPSYLPSTALFVATGFVTRGEGRGDQLPFEALFTVLFVTCILSFEALFKVLFVTYILSTTSNVYVTYSLCTHSMYAVHVRHGTKMLNQICRYAIVYT